MPETEVIHPCVVVESPYAGRVEVHLAYAKRAVLDCLARGEYPIASHLLFTQPGILLDHTPEERALGIAAGHGWIARADYVVAYIDYGVSKGMEQGCALADALGVPVRYRNIGPN